MPSSPTVTQKLDQIRRFTPRGIEFWCARAVMPILGYDQWRNFRNVIERAMEAFDAAGESSSHHFADASKVGGTGGPEAEDFFLSRAACYVIAMNGDPRKPEIAEAQRYYAIQTRRIEKVEQYIHDKRRVETRKRITTNTKRLGDAAKSAGVQRYGLFHSAGIRAMYNMRLDEIKARRGLRKDENWLDRMGAEELAINDFRVTQTESKLRRENISGEQNAIDAHAEVSKGIRNLITRLGNTMPEDLPVEPPIKEIERRIAKKIAKPKR